MDIPYTHTVNDFLFCSIEDRPPLVPHTLVELVDMPVGELNGDQMLELFLTGKVEGVPTEKKYIPRV